MTRTLALIILSILAPAYGQTKFMVCGDRAIAERLGIGAFVTYYAQVDGNYFVYSQEDNEWNTYCEDKDMRPAKILRMRVVCSLSPEGVGKLEQSSTNDGGEWITTLEQRLDFRNFRVYYGRKYRKCEANVLPKAWVERVEKERLAK